MNPVRKFKQVFLSNGVNKYLLSGIITIVVVVTDQVTKSLINKSITLHKSITVFEGFFNLTHIRNSGGAFSFLSGVSSIFFMFASSIALIVILIYLIRTPNDKLLLITSLSLISGGAVGNMIDRVRLGEVIDFVDLFYKDFHWPAFNIADSAITIGVFILFLDMIPFRKER